MMSAHQCIVSTRDKRVYLIEKDDTWGRCPRPRKNLPYSPLTLADIFVKQLWTFDANEVEAAFFCHR